MIYFARIGENEYEVEIDDGQILLDGEPIANDLELIAEPEVYSLLYDGRSYELLIESDRYDYSVTLRSEQFQVQVEDDFMVRKRFPKKPLLLLKRRNRKMSSTISKLMSPQFQRLTTDTKHPNRRLLLRIARLNLHQRTTCSKTHHRN